MKKLIYSSFITLIICIFLISCSPKEQTTVNENVIGTSYPILGNTSENGYPVLENDAYPAQIGLEKNLEIGPEFIIDEPATINSSTVSGKGPAGVPIILIDVSQMGEKLSETIIDNEGHFLFTLEYPLIKAHTIGIQLGDLAGTNIDPNDFVSSPTYYDKPMIGIVFDVANVQ